MLEGNGSATYELVGGAKGVFSGSVLPSWASSPSDRNINFDGTKAYVLQTNVTYIPPPFTIVMICTPNTLLNGATGRTFLAHDTGGNNGYRIAGLTSTQWGLTFGAVANYTYTNLVPTLGLEHLFAVSVNANGGQSIGYLAGPNIRGSQAVNVGTVSGTPSQVTLSWPQFADIGHFDGKIKMAAMFGSVLSGAQIFNFYDEPFAMLRGPDVYRYGWDFGQPPGAANTFLNILPLLGVG